MQYCNKLLIKNNNEILQYFNKNNDIALVMHWRALLDMTDQESSISNIQLNRQLIVNTLFFISLVQCFMHDVRVTLIPLMGSQELKVFLTSFITMTEET